MDTTTMAMAREMAAAGWTCQQMAAGWVAVPPSSAATAGLVLTSCATRVDACAQAARALLARVAPQRRTSTPRGLGRRTGCRCGSREGGAQATDCWTCRHDAE